MARLHRDAMTALVTEIVSGARPVGDMLPREVDLAENFGVSRGVARETVRALEERGLVSVKHGKGATVVDADQWDVFDPDVLAAILSSSSSDVVLGEYLECRRILEVEAAGFAAQRASDEDIANIAAALERMEEAARQPSTPLAERNFHEADIAFHQGVIAATGNRALGRLVEQIHSALLVARYPLARPEYRQERSLPEHRRIYEAIAARDVDAARSAMDAHLNTIMSYLRELKGRPKKRAARRKAAA